MGGRVCAGLLLACWLSAGCAARQGLLRPDGEMPYPPKGKPVAEDIYHVQTGLKVPFDGMMEIVSGARLVCVGETHDNLHAHRVELSVIRELHRRFPGRVAIGMEMFREPQQEVLDRWTRGELTELEFLKAAKWHSTWGSDFGYYREILAFARDNGIDVIALNPSKELQEEVKRAGLDDVSADLRARLPEIGPADPYQREAMKAVYGAHLPSAGAFDSFFRVQMLWEETMAARIVEYLGSPRGEGKKMVTITGGWHVRYGFGIPKKVVRRLPLPYAIVLPEEIEFPPDKKDRLMDVRLPPIPLPVADFVWYVPYEDLEGNRVRLGVRIADGEGGVIVEGVQEGSPAAKAGIPEGSRIVSFDGKPVGEAEDLFYLVAEKREGDRAAVVFRQDGAERIVEVSFFRMPEKDRHR